MLSILLAVALSTVNPQPSAYCSVPCHVTKKKVFKKKTVVVPTPVHSKSDCCAPPTIININVEQSQAQEQHEAQMQKQKIEGVGFYGYTHPTLGIGVLGGVGTSFCLPQGYLGLLGLRLHLWPVHLGAQVYTEFYYGSGASLLVYPVQTGVVNWHLNGGVYWFHNKPYTNITTPRQLDLTLGTGLEVMVLPHLYLTGDLRVRAPNPVALSNVNAWPVLGESFTQTQLLLGVMVSN